MGVVEQQHRFAGDRILKADPARHARDGVRVHAARALGSEGFVGQGEQALELGLGQGKDAESHGRLLWTSGAASWRAGRSRSTRFLRFALKAGGRNMQVAAAVGFAYTARSVGA